MRVSVVQSTNCTIVLMCVLCRNSRSKICLCGGDRGSQVNYICLYTYVLESNNTNHMCNTPTFGYAFKPRVLTVLLGSPLNSQLAANFNPWGAQLVVPNPHASVQKLSTGCTAWPCFTTAVVSDQIDATLLLIDHTLKQASFL